MTKDSVDSFYRTLSSLPKCYQWDTQQKQIVATKTRGVSKGATFNPITAVAFRRGAGTFSNTRTGTVQAAKAIGLDSTFAKSVYDAVCAKSNRGNTQVLRGRILSRLNS